MSEPLPLDGPPAGPGMALFAAVFHRNTQAASFTRTSDGLLVDMNDAWLALTGHSREQALGKTTVELGIWGPENQRASALQNLEGSPESQTAFEATLYSRLGLKRRVAVSATAFELGGVPHLLCFLRDVTGEQMAAQTLAEKLDFIEKLTARAPTLLFQLRVRPDGSLHFPYVSRKTGLNFEINRPEMATKGEAALDHVHADDRAAVLQAVKSSAERLSPWRQEFRVILHDGKTAWVYVDSQPERQDDGAVLWTGSMTNVTKRRMHDDELARTRAMLDAKARGLSIALDNMSQGILALDKDARILQYNQRLVELLEIDPGVMAGFADGHELLAYQVQRGDFGADYSWVESVSRPLLQDQSVDTLPERYLRKTRGGRTLEVKSLSLPGGGVVRTFSDVTHFVEAQAALFKSESRFRSLTALSSDWFWEQDEQFRFVSLAGEDGQDRRFPAEADVGKRRWDIKEINLSAAQWAEHRRTVEAHETFHDFEFQRRDPDGRVRWLSISGMPVFDAEGQFCGYRGVGSDITERKHREDESQRLAFYDPLTGLPNRRLLLDRLTQALVTSGRSQSQGALLFIDLDNFKDLNDTLGHDVGDRLLEKVANRLVTCIRQGDTVARFGGDEFVVMLEDLSFDMQEAVDQVKTVGQKILATLNLPFELQGKSHYSTPSIGIAIFSGQTEGVDELLKRADLAMYQSKSAGRNTLRFFDPEMQSAVAQRAALEADLRLGLERGELVLHYQTVVNHLGRVTGVEALVRWQHPKRGLVTPMEFIKVAEQTGLIVPLGQWVLQTACQQLVDWAGNPLTRHLSVAVNISAREFHQPEFVDRILGTLKATGADANLLKLELTESLLLDDIDDAILKMVELRSAGVRFSLDDFGTGYSSLSYLRRLPLDELKIDRSFVRDVLTDSNDAAIARTIVALAHSLGLEVVAEGVETDGQREFLKRNGCQSFQGFSVGRPAPVAEIHLHNSENGFEDTAAEPAYPPGA